VPQVTGSYGSADGPSSARCYSRPARCTPGRPLLALSRFGDAGPVEYTRVEPDVVDELAVDSAVDVMRGRPVWRHPARLVRIRAELHPSDLRYASEEHLITP
jgi:hypothetical protein